MNEKVVTYTQRYFSDETHTKGSIYNCVSCMHMRFMHLFIHRWIDGLHVCIFCEQNCALLARPTQGMHMSTLCSTSSVTSLGH